jgi:hypothetical protein
VRPGEILDLQRSLYEYLRFPAAAVAEFYDKLYDQLELAWNLQKRTDPEMSKFARSTWIAWFYPAERGRDLLQLMRKPLYGAPTYQVTADIVDAVTAMYRKTSMAQTVSFQAADLPSLTGFLWLDKPVRMTDIGEDAKELRALSWGPVTVQSSESSLQGDGIRFTVWSLDSDELASSGMVPLPGAPLQLSSSQITPFGKNLKRIDLSLRDGKLVPPSEGKNPDDILYWAQTLWLFMRTEIVTSQQPQIERPFRRRAQRVLGTDSVNVVLLRRVRHGNDEIALRDIDWTCRWVVQAHWRHLDSYEVPGHMAAPRESDPDHCSVCDARITHVRAYVKGPDGLPLKAVPEKLYRVAR